MHANRLEKVVPIVAKSPDKDPEEAVQENSQPPEVTEKSHKKKLGTQKTRLKKRKRSGSRKLTPIDAGWNVLADAGAEHLKKLTKKTKTTKKKHSADALQPVDQVQPNSYIGRALKEVTQESHVVGSDTSLDSSSERSTSSSDSPSESPNDSLDSSDSSSSESESDLDMSTTSKSSGQS